MEKTLPIAFSAGAYGTYLEWALNTLICDDEIKDPLTNLGNSHDSVFGLHVKHIDGVLEYLQSNNNRTTIRFHPKNTKDESLKDNLELTLTRFEQMIMIYPDKNHEIMCANNRMTKIWRPDIDIYQGPLAYMNFNDIYNNFPIDPSIPLAEIPIWIRREHMSYNFFKACRSQVEWYFPDIWGHPRCLIITVAEILHEFEKVIKKIFNFWNKKQIRPTKDIMPIHHKMLIAQKNLGQDQLCHDIINSVIFKNGNMTWGQLPLASEAWIQQTLRNHGIEIRCHELNIFPQDTESLKKICFMSQQ